KYKIRATIGALQRQMTTVRFKNARGRALRFWRRCRSRRHDTNGLSRRSCSCKGPGEAALARGLCAPPAFRPTPSHPVHTGHRPTRGPASNYVHLLIDAVTSEAVTTSAVNEQ